MYDVWTHKRQFGAKTTPAFISVHQRSSSVHFGPTAFIQRSSAFIQRSFSYSLTTDSTHTLYFARFYRRFTHVEIPAFISVHQRSSSVYHNLHKITIWSVWIDFVSPLHHMDHFCNNCKFFSGNRKICGGWDMNGSHSPNFLGGGLRTNCGFRFSIGMARIVLIS